MIWSNVPKGDEYTTVLNLSDYRVHTTNSSEDTNTNLWVVRWKVNDILQQKSTNNLDTLLSLEMLLGNITKSESNWEIAPLMEELSKLTSKLEADDYISSKAIYTLKNEIRSGNTQATLNLIKYLKFSLEEENADSMRDLRPEISAERQELIWTVASLQLFERRIRDPRESMKMTGRILSNEIMRAISALKYLAVSDSENKYGIQDLALQVVDTVVQIMKIEKWGKTLLNKVAVRQFLTQLKDISGIKSQDIKDILAWENINFVSEQSQIAA